MSASNADEIVNAPSGKISVSRPDGTASISIRLTPAQVIFARDQARRGARLSTIAAVLSVRPGVLHNAITGENWKHLNCICPPVSDLRINQLDCELPDGPLDVIDVGLTTRASNIVLTAEMVIEARTALFENPFGVSVSALSEKFGVNATTLRYAVLGKGWKHLNKLAPPVNIRRRKREIRKVRKSKLDQQRLVKLQARIDRENMRQIDRLYGKRITNRNGMAVDLAINIRELARVGNFDAYGFAVTNKIPLRYVYEVLNGKRWSELNHLYPPI